MDGCFLVRGQIDCQIDRSDQIRWMMIDTVHTMVWIASISVIVGRANSSDSPINAVPAM